MTLPADWQSRTAPLLESNGNVVQLKKLNHKHMYIMDIMLANPTFTNNQIAELAGVTPAWCSTVINSDLFRARLAERRGLLDEEFNRRITSKVHNLAEKAIDCLQEALEDTGDQCLSHMDKHKVARTALEAAGILGKSSGITINNNDNSIKEVAVNDNRTVIAAAVSAARERIQQNAHDTVAQQRLVAIEGSVETGSSNE